MSERLTLPGTIPGLLRRGSPVQLTRLSGTVEPGVYVPSNVEHFVALDRIGVMLLDDIAGLALDLSEPTGRWHALLWLEEQVDGDWIAACEGTDFLGVVFEVLVGWIQGGHDDLRADQIDTLRRVVLHVAGMEVKP